MAADPLRLKFDAWLARNPTIWAEVALSAVGLRADRSWGLAIRVVAAPTQPTRLRPDPAPLTACHRALATP